MRAHNPVFLSLCATLVSLSAACMDAAGPALSGPSIDAPVVVQTVTLVPAQATLPAGDHVAMTATLIDASGEPVTMPVTWTTSDTTVASVSGSGEVVALAPGRVVITVRASGAYATAPVTIVPAVASDSISVDSTSTTADSVTVSPATAEVAVGDSVQLAAERWRAGDPAPADSVITWSSSSPQVATVSSSGLVTGVGAGVASIRATYQGRTATGVVTVLLPPPVEPPPSASVASVMLDPATVAMQTGDTAQATATLKDASGAILTGRVIAWMSSNSAVVSVSPTGLLTAMAAGSATVTAVSEEQVGSTDVTVAVAPSPSSSSGSAALWANESSSFATLTDQHWNSLPSLGWRKSDNYKLSLVADPTVPTGDPEVLQFFYPTGFSGGGYGPAQVAYSISANEIYLGFYWKLSPNWQGHSTGVNKMLYIFQREGTNREAVFLVARGAPGGPYHLQISNEASDGGKWFTQNVDNVAVVPGRWYKVELHLRRSSADAAPDGLVEWWVDGQLAARYPNAKLRGVPFSEVHIDPVWGGVDNTISKTHDDYQRFGVVHLSGR